MMDFDPGWEKYAITIDSNLRDAAQLINKNQGLPLLVTSPDGQLEFVFTDGDLRRAFLKDVSPTSKLNDVRPRKTTVVFDDKVSWSYCVSVFENSQHELVPVVSRNAPVGVMLKGGKCDFEALGVVMAGGYGSRMGALTKRTPKPLVLLNGRPLIEYVLNNYVRCGVRKIIIIGHYLGEQLAEKYSDGKYHGIPVEFILEEEPLGTAGGLSLIRPDDLLQLNFVMNCDLPMVTDLRQLGAFHLMKKATISVQGRSHRIQNPFGVLAVETNDQVADIKEKPVYIDWISSGIYCLDKSIFYKLSPKTYLDMPELIKGFINDGSVFMHPSNEDWIDVGDQQLLEEAKQRGLSQ